MQLVSWGGVRLSSLGTSATNWPIVPASDDRWWVWSSRWNENWQGKLKYSDETCPNATLSTTNPHLGLNPDRRGRKPATNRLSYDTVFNPCSCCCCSLDILLECVGLISSPQSWCGYLGFEFNKYCRKLYTFDCKFISYNKVKNAKDR
jgi:hypothetical protein